MDSCNVQVVRGWAHAWDAVGLHTCFAVNIQGNEECQAIFVTTSKLGFRGVLRNTWWNSKRWDRLLCRAGTELSSLGLQGNSNLTTPLCWNLTAKSPRLHRISVACPYFSFVSFLFSLGQVQGLRRLLHVHTCISEVSCLVFLHPSLICHSAFELIFLSHQLQGNQNLEVRKGFVHDPIPFLGPAQLGISPITAFELYSARLWKISAQSEKDEFCMKGRDGFRRILGCGLRWLTRLFRLSVTFLRSKHLPNIIQAHLFYDIA